MKNPGKNSQTRENAHHMTLGMSSSWDMLRKLEWEIDIFKSVMDAKFIPGDELARSIRKPMYAAINASITACHLVDWVWHDLAQLHESKHVFLEILKLPANSGLSQVVSEIRKIPELNAAHQIANASKHSHLERMTEGFSTPVFIDYWEKDGEIFINQSGRARLESEDRISEQTIYSILNTNHDWWAHILIELKIPER